MTIFFVLLLERDFWPHAPKKTFFWAPFFSASVEDTIETTKQ
jgi:hypothetical protein